jgi:hypothetical protein
MAIPAAKILAKWIVNAGLGISPPNPANPNLLWQTTYSRLPDDLPDARIACFSNGKVREPRENKSKKVVNHPLVQIRVRHNGTSYDAAEAKAEAIEEALNNLVETNVVIGAVTYTIQAATVYIPTTPMGQEEENLRWHFSLNVRLTFKDA